jgi:hypothetical protein
VSTNGRPIRCACCQRLGRNDGRNLIESCYARHRRQGTLDGFPRATQPAEPWIPTGSHGERMLDRYQELAAIRPPLTRERIAFELGVSERQVQRYAAAIRTRREAR